MTHVWPYESFEDRERIGVEARKTGKWPPKTQEFIVTQETRSSVGAVLAAGGKKVSTRRHADGL